MFLFHGASVLMVRKETGIVPQDKARVITVQVRRGDSDENRLAAYEVPVEAGQSVLGVLQYIYDRLDSTLAFSCSCRIGLCAACLVRVNGKVVRACTTLAEGDMLIEPYKDAAVIRDLVTQLPPLAK
jgi:succinate dehydrogenase / fumarate reductase iron-sulfur subunit